MVYSNVSISIDGKVGFDKNLKPIKSLENLARQSSFFSPDKEVIIDTLKKRAISEIRFLDYLIDALASLIFCGNYETTLQKIDRFCKKATHLSEQNKISSSLLDEKNISKEKESHESKVINNAGMLNGPDQTSSISDQSNVKFRKDDDVDTPHRSFKPLPQESDEPMSNFKVDFHEQNKPLSSLLVHLVTHELRKYAEPLEAIDSKHIKRIADTRYLTSDYLDRIEALEILNKIKERVAGRPQFSDLAIFLDKRISQVEAYHLKNSLNKLRSYDVARLSDIANQEELNLFIYCNHSFLTRQKGNIELYNIIYKLCENLKEINVPNKYYLEKLISILNSINEVNFSLLPADVWLNIFRYIDDSNKYRKFSNWFCMFVLSKRMKNLTQQHVNSRIYHLNIFLENTLKTNISASEAVAYTVKNKVKSINLSHEDLSVDDLKNLLKGSPDLTKIHIRSLSDEMLPILYEFKKLKILSLQGRVLSLDLTNFESLEELTLNYLHVQSVIFRENDKTLKKVNINGCDNTFAFERLYALESLEMHWWQGDSPLEINSPVLQRLILTFSYCKKITLDKNVRSVKEVIVRKLQLDELIFPQDLPQIETIEILDNERLEHLALPLNAPALKALIVKNNNLLSLQFSSNLNSCKKVELRTGKVPKVVFPDEMPVLESIEVESSGVEKLILPISAPNILNIKVAFCRQLVHLALPSNPKVGAIMDLYSNSNLNRSEVADKDKYIAYFEPGRLLL